MNNPPPMHDKPHARLSVAPVRHWQLRSKILAFDATPCIMGILNVTPDSFSDGGRYDTCTKAVEHGLRLIEQGAGLLDVGGESTRPQSVPVPVNEELRRVIPVIAELARQTKVPISIDTSKAVVAEAALDAGAEVVNDVTGLDGDPNMVPLVRRTSAGVCVMHMQGNPQTMQVNPQYKNVVSDVAQYLAERRDNLVEHGIDRQHICLDPGIGFGKTHQHNLDLLQHAADFHHLGCPLLFGHSRKGFIAHVVGDSQRDRLAGTIGVALALARHGIQILRVHDVQPVADAIRLFHAAGGFSRTG